jgi:very-short-patch-repair endonuclease
VDVYVPSARLVVEADGRNWHTRWEDFESDRRRDNALAARGIQVLRFAYGMLKTDPGKCLEQTLTTCLVRAA